MSLLSTWTPLLDFLAANCESVFQWIDISPWQQQCAWCCAFREGQRNHLEGLWWRLDAQSLADGWESAHRKCLFGWVAKKNITQLALRRSAWLYMSSSCLGFLYCLWSWKKKPHSCGAHTLLTVSGVQILVSTCDYTGFLFGRGCDVPT